MASTPTLTLCDDLVTALLGAWTDMGASDGVTRCYFKRIGDSDRPETKLAGRQVYVFPTDYDNGPATRGEDEFIHSVSVLVVERYADAGDPPTAWIDTRVDFVYEQIVQGLDFSHDGPASWNKKLTTLSADVTVCDVEKLTGGGKLFYSMTELAFSEIRDA